MQSNTLFALTSILALSPMLALAQASNDRPAALYIVTPNNTTLVGSFGKMTECVEASKNVQPGALPIDVTPAPYMRLFCVQNK